MKRRSFLHGAGSAAAVSFLAACARTFRIPLDTMAAPSGGPGTERDTNGIWQEGAAYARWTPSPHNTQPWRLRVISATRAEVYYDPRRLLPTTDPTGAFTIMGLTMFVDYLSMAVAHRGYSVAVDIPERPLDFTATRPVRFATLELASTDAVPLFDRQLILERKTSRLPYDGHPVPDETMTVLASLAEQHGHHLAWSSDPSMVAWTVELNRFTLFRDLDDAPTRVELRRWIRCSDDEAAGQLDGLWSHCLRLPGWLLKAFFDQHEKWGRGWRAKVCGQMLVKGMHGTRTVAWWSGPFDTPADWISAGRAFGRTWLELTQRGIQLHPFGSVITNPQAHARLIDRVGARGGGNTLWLLARLGRSERAPRSYRVAEASVFLDDGELA